MYELKCVPMYPSGDRAISCMYTCVLPVYLFSQPLICLSIYLFVHARMLAGMLASMNACTHIHHNLCGGCRCKVRRRIFKYIHRRTCIDPVLTSEIDLTYRLARLPPPYFFTCCAVRSGASSGTATVGIGPDPSTIRGEWALQGGRGRREVKGWGKKKLGAATPAYQAAPFFNSFCLRHLS